ncbi:3-hydroxy-D-aspartate aldolase BhcC [Chelativorans sp. M5D2P16]|uniref:3-hydroxy-D-aspartate aldolase BhcC n=1 Tax=Chelativorans sp. M5D2P16 TaxID=3095678 RepID=UPI002AC9F523|nr:3-hydroxy-D-aspartate aldolase BhcC [Chelativorans sp. M5D2P16]MDZ5697857.1 DSD1 family PLP-dependent enzyme [Chelativorans sp. M5D2P16]
MNTQPKITDFEVGYDIPAAIGMDESEIQTPCLVVDLDALDRNIDRMQHFANAMGVRLRVHGKMHKSADIALLQIEKGAVGICCQKVSEAESFARAGVKDILVSNQVRDPAKIDRLARLPKLGARTIVCIDDKDNIADLSEAAARHGTEIEVLVEIDCGAGRCGVAAGEPVVELAKAVEAAPNLTFSGLQAYQGAAQHVHSFEERKAKIDAAIDMVRKTVDMLKAEGLECAIVGGAGTGSYYFEGNSGVYNEMQCGSYAFMDADYQRVLDKDGKPISEFENALFILTSVMSHAKPDKAICDAGLKAQSVDSGLPVIFGRDDVKYIKCSDEHGVIEDPNGVLKPNEKLKLVPGHIDPTCNVHDWYVGVRGGKVEALWPVTARGKAY